MAQPNHHTNPIVFNEENAASEEAEKIGTVSDIESSEDANADDADTLEPTSPIPPKRA